MAGLLDLFRGGQGGQGGQRGGGGMPDNLLTNIGIGLLAGSGRRVGVHPGIGPGLAAGLSRSQGTEVRGLKTQAIRDRLGASSRQQAEDARQRTAQDALAERLAASDHPQGGLLAEVVRAGGMTAISRGIAGQAFPTTTTLDPVDRLRILKMENDLRGDKTDAANDAAKVERTEQGLKFTVGQNIEKVKNLLKLNKRRAEITKNFKDSPWSTIFNTLNEKDLGMYQEWDLGIADLVNSGGLAPFRGDERVTDSARKSMFSAKPNKATLPAVADRQLQKILSGLEEAQKIFGDTTQAPSLQGQTPTQLTPFASPGRKGPATIFNNTRAAPASPKRGDVWNHPTLGTLEMTTGGTWKEVK